MRKFISLSLAFVFLTTLFVPSAEACGGVGRFGVGVVRATGRVLLSPFRHRAKYRYSMTITSGGGCYSSVGYTQYVPVAPPVVTPSPQSCPNCPPPVAPPVPEPTPTPAPTPQAPSKVSPAPVAPTKSSFLPDSPEGFLSLLNAERARYGLRPLILDGRLASHAAYNTWAGHDPNSMVAGAGQVWASPKSYQASFRMWMKSPAHRAILLQAKESVGIAICRSGCTANVK